MQQRRSVCVPINSPAWGYYVRQGWVVLWSEGTWVTLTQP